MISVLRQRFGAALFVFACSPLVAQAALIGHLTSPASSGVTSGSNWAPPPGGEGFRIDWNISQNGDGTWHYIYDLSDQGSGTQSPRTSHIIFQLSQNILATDLYNFNGQVDSKEFGTFGPHPSNPNFPAGKSIFGIKMNLTGTQSHIEFDSTRQPMWGDFYAKGGSSSYAYNTDLGVTVANPNDYLGTPVDAGGQVLRKILVPDTLIPEPATFALLAIGGLVLRRRR